MENETVFTKPRECNCTWSLIVENETKHIRRMRKIHSIGINIPQRIRNYIQNELLKKSSAGMEKLFRDDILYYSATF
jgi:hypothetical protein